MGTPLRQADFELSDDEKARRVVVQMKALLAVARWSSRVLRPEEHAWFGEAGELMPELELTLRRAESLVRRLGQPAACKGCGRAMWWVELASGKRGPYDRDGASHFGTCPKASDFRRARR